MPDLWDKLKKLRRVEAPPRPPNTFTSHEYADHEGIPYRTAHEHLAQLFKSGKLRKTRIVIVQGDVLRTTSAWQLTE